MDLRRFRGRTARPSPTWGQSKAWNSNTPST